MEIVKHVYLVRHGETDSNVDGIFRGRDSALTERGKKQAQIVAERIKHLAIEALVSSTYPRALDTASAIAEATGLMVEPSELFVETGEASVLRGKPKDHPERIAALAAMDAQNHPDYRHSDEENFRELSERAQAALDFLRNHEAASLCVVTHGAFLRVLMGSVLFRDDFLRSQFVQMLRHFKTENTGVSHISHTNDRGWQLITLNDDAHLL